MQCAGGMKRACGGLRRKGRNLGWQDSARTALALVLCVLMADQPLMAANTDRRGPTAGGAQVGGDGRVLHALDRLTFGPRPGDVSAVETMGLTPWFEMQLDPQKIDDSALDARLAEFPAMQLPQAELMARYPSQQMVRQMAQKDGSLPQNPVERAIYADQMEFYRVQQQKQAAKEMTGTGSASNAMAGNLMAGDSMTENMTPTPAPIERHAPGPVAQSAAATQPTPALVDTASAQNERLAKLYNDIDTMNLINLPPEERMRRVLAMAPADFVAFRQGLKAGDVAQFEQGLSPQQKELFAAMQNSTQMVGGEAMQSRLIRDIYSNRQLEAVMTDFWLNHFNVYVRKDANEPYLVPAYEREAIRPHALGKFEDLLVATAESPAMLVYLDNWQSIGPDSPAAKNSERQAARAGNPQAKAALKDRGLNENYGRELMELHTLGVNGGYTQQDVIAVAKVFTGWTTTPPAQGAQFQFDERRHEPGPKTLLGKTIQENGMNEGLEVLHMLATSPATAKFISTKLAVRFVSDDPSPALVERMAQAFLKSDGDIKTVLRTMFQSPEFWAPGAERSKVKTPEEYVLSAVRASGAQVNNAQPLVQALDRMGMPLYGMQTPNGYSWKNDSWVSTGELVDRMNFALTLSTGRLPGVRMDWSNLLGESVVASKTAGMEMSQGSVDPATAAKEQKLELILLGQPLDRKTREVVFNQSNNAPPAGPRNADADERQLAMMAGLMLGSPEFQRR